MNRSDFESLIELVERSNPHDPRTGEDIVDQIHELRDRCAPQGDLTGALEAAALLVQHRTELRGASPESVGEVVARLLTTAAGRYAGPQRHEPMVLKAPSPQDPIPSELSETSLRLVSDLYLGEILVREGHVTKEQLAKALDFQKVTGERVGEALVNLNVTTWEQIEDALRHQGKPGSATTNLKPTGSD